MRRAYDLCWGLVVGFSTLISVGLLASVVFYLFFRAIPTLELSLLTQPSSAAGAGGGVLYQLLGTLILASSALVIQLPLAVAISLALVVYLHEHSVARWFEVALLTANGIPSILFGIFAFILFSQFLEWGKSWLAGGLILGLMSTPMAALALTERLRAIPSGFAESARALGLNRSQTIWRILIPASRDGIFSGSLLGVARSAGETAPILFAAAVFSGATLPTGIVDSPVTALPYHLFVLAQDSFDPAAQDRLWGAAWVLLGVTATCSLIAWPLRFRHTTQSEVFFD